MGNIELAKPHIKKKGAIFLIIFLLVISIFIISKLSSEENLINSPENSTLNSISSKIKIGGGQKLVPFFRFQISYERWALMFLTTIECFALALGLEKQERKNLNKSMISGVICGVLGGIISTTIYEIDAPTTVADLSILLGILAGIPAGIFYFFLDRKYIDYGRDDIRFKVKALLACSIYLGVWLFFLTTLSGFEKKTIYGLIIAALMSFWLFGIFISLFFRTKIWKKGLLFGTPSGLFAAIIATGVATSFETREYAIFFITYPVIIGFFCGMTTGFLFSYFHDKILFMFSPFKKSFAFSFVFLGLWLLSISSFEPSIDNFNKNLITTAIISSLLFAIFFYLSWDRTWKFYLAEKKIRKKSQDVGVYMGISGGVLGCAIVMSFLDISNIILVFCVTVGLVCGSISNEIYMAAYKKFLNNFFNEKLILLAILYFSIWLYILGISGIYINELANILVGIGIISAIIFGYLFLRFFDDDSWANGIYCGTFVGIVCGSALALATYALNSQNSFSCIVLGVLSGLFTGLIFSIFQNKMYDFTQRVIISGFIFFMFWCLFIFTLGDYFENLFVQGLFSAVIFGYLDEKYLEYEIIKQSKEWNRKGLRKFNQKKLFEALKCFEKAISLYAYNDDAWANKGVVFLAQNITEEAMICFDKALEINPNNEKALLNKGIIFYNYEKYQQSFDYFDKVLYINQNIEEAWYHKGLILRIWEKDNQALTCFDRAIRIDPNHENSWFQMGDIFLNQRIFEKSLFSFDNVVRINPGNEIAQYNRGTTLLKMNKFDTALGCFDSVLSINPINEKAMSKKGKTLVHLGNGIDALEYCNDATELNENYEDAFSNKALALDYLGFHRKAIQFCNRALKINNNYAQAWNNKGQALFNRNDFLEAKNCFNKAIELDNFYEEPWNNKGKLLIQQTKPNEALNFFDKAISINHYCIDAWYNKGTLLFSLNRFEESIICFNKVIEINYTNYKSWFCKANALNNLNKFQEALESYNMVTKINPNFEIAWYNKGFVLDELSRYKEAIICYSEAVKIKLNFAKAWYNMGVSSNKLERFEEAIEYYDKAISINPNYENAWYNKGETLSKIEEYEEALFCFEKTLKINPDNEKAKKERENCLISLKRD